MLDGGADYAKAFAPAVTELFEVVFNFPKLFQVGRHLMKAGHYRLFRERAFMTWREVTTEQIAA